MGKKPVLAIAALGLVPVGLGWCFLSRDALWLGYLLSAAGAVLWAGVETANFNIVLEMAGSGDEPGETRATGSSYVAVNSVIINIAGCLGGLAAGAIAQGLRNWSWESPIPGLGRFTFYEVLFAISGLLRLAAVVIFLPQLHEPTARPAREALRFITANIYNNLFNGVMQPIRMMRLRQRESFESPEVSAK
jgi:MFS family permease